MQRTRTFDVFVSALVVLLIGITLAPAIARLQRSPSETRCQSNLHQWAGAMALYLADYHETYPTNRDTMSSLSNHVMLTPGTAAPLPDGKPTRFVKGVNWVEALYPYLWTSAAKTGSDWKSFRKCPSARDTTEPPGTTDNARYASMSYAFNAFLVEQPKAAIRYRANTMMMREMDRRVNSILRPANVANPSVASNNAPKGTFLTTVDQDLSIAAPKPLPTQHGTGSYILFTDGHTKWFSGDYYPKGAASSGLLSVTDSWDAADACWYNYNSDAFVSPSIRKTIAITP